jgi:DUF4097 and DUF4098 domain-containing protein YvlB
MTKKVRDSSGLTGVVLLAFFFVLAGDVHRASGKDETLRRRYDLKSGGRITLENTRGNIRISSWDQDRVELVAEKSGDSEEDMELVPIEIDSRDDELKITSLFPEYAPELYVRVNYRLRVPREVDLKLVSTINGEIEISGVSGRANLVTDHGPITVEGFSGILKAESLAYGEIDVELDKVDSSDHIVLQSINGVISIRIPKDVDAFWICRTLNGKIESDIPFNIKNNFGPHVAHHPNEDGEPLVRAYSVNGDIRIDQR